MRARLDAYEPYATAVRPSNLPRAVALPATVAVVSFLISPLDAIQQGPWSVAFFGVQPVPHRGGPCHSARVDLGLQFPQ